ncbi:NDP-sugar epimerase, includes UDP-GlcNAc-inverting 4,6-dehydratase FlaA1 and capsular polysaccharide biosynthesis protein EpsC [Pseudobacteriovorax antillogorgiicola]|uniref:NDP-sugar epimerase, includes UDP-GlcNAc-inverting 4,6-dehydratase FlaA1 and capsular polysaccharide biosynthesis protein EpsC n=2 Tax=Pseudobacteriovorax antillogorgiicola TaxID=1513793 RepID=A0A1Y6CLC1_9BACT|nr:FlaA1/EpsC-like NDP-sugar epimerase [Pseudobacteriovorax antillogorgiicola]SMF75406.1 NDP-sugar epimerase, includes UDP-GlcNAc-inverting 4,6-dehydratase FlaA1 and capsular polysaccharide biosynthesis protein EpsC [Pseudobacteriovorax antillogorgiicola]
MKLKLRRNQIYDLIVSSFSLPMATLLCGAYEDFDNYSGVLAFSIAGLCKLCLLRFYFISDSIWRFVAILDIKVILKFSISSSIACSIVLVSFFSYSQIILRLLVTDGLLISFLLMTARLFFTRNYRNLQSSKETSKQQSCVIIGAGNAGQQLYREIKNFAPKVYNIVYFIDDNKTLFNRLIFRTKVIGPISNLESIIKENRIDVAFIAIPSMSKKRRSKIIHECISLNIQVKTLPSLSDIIDDRVHFSEVRPINIEDILLRDEVCLNKNLVEKDIKDKVILVTGAGGSIGSQLCRQIVKFKPKTVLLFEICEYFAYKLEQELTDLEISTPFITIVGDVRNDSRVRDLIRTYRPSIIFHAAAYKHVPLMETNVSEAISNNICGTRVVARAASDYKVEKFILISSDKAVNPTNVMGASKRIAEIVCQQINEISQTKFIVLRFGNVIGSNGSVVPLFLKQIKLGGPVTVTHPEVTRYFMSISEACQLVLQAASQGNGGEIFVLDMGDPIKVRDLASKLIELAGLVPNDDIDIVYTGLRKGEKLYEELLADKETTLPTIHPKVKVAKARSLDPSLTPLIDNILNSITESCNRDDVRVQLQSIVPEYDYRNLGGALRPTEGYTGPLTNLN